MKVFADNLKHRAKALNLSDAEVARRAGLAERRYGNYAIGRREPDLATLVRIAAVLGCSVDDLLSDQSVKPSRETELRLRVIASITALPEQELKSILVQVEALAMAATAKTSSS